MFASSKVPSHTGWRVFSARRNFLDGLHQVGSRERVRRSCGRKQHPFGFCPFSHVHLSEKPEKTVGQIAHDRP